MKIEVNYHNSIKLTGEKIIYFDPFNIETKPHDADIIFFTHNHYDHMSKEDLQKVSNKDTILVVPESCVSTLIEFTDNEMFKVKPNGVYEVQGIKFTTIPAYNVNKLYHPQASNYVGYIAEIEDEKYYVAGDTDVIDETKQVKCDYAFVPVGGIYTMNYREAAQLVNDLKPKMAIPTHYGSIVGKDDDGINFSKLLDSDITCKVFY